LRRTGILRLGRVCSYRHSHRHHGRDDGSGCDDQASLAVGNESLGGHDGEGRAREGVDEAPKRIDERVRLGYLHGQRSHADRRRNTAGQDSDDDSRSELDFCVIFQGNVNRAVSEREYLELELGNVVNVEPPLRAAGEGVALALDVEMLVSEPA